MVSRVARAAALLSTACLFATALAQLAALRAAGLHGSAPPHAAAFKSLISTLTNNLIWLVATGLGLVIVLFAGMMAFGDIRAPERLFRIVETLVPEVDQVDLRHRPVGLGLMGYQDALYTLSIPFASTIAALLARSAV